MTRILTLAYGIVSHVTFLATFVHAVESCTHDLRAEPSPAGVRS